MRINNIQKNYGKTSKILKFYHSIDIEPPRCKEHSLISCMICFPRKKSGSLSASSLQRSRTTITDYIICNKFDLFCTFTFNPQLVDSMDIVECKKKMYKWINNQKRHSPDLKYLIVPELHKSGRVHFHALFAEYNGVLTDAKRMQKGKIIYNLSQWKYGFSTATIIQDIEKTGNYVKKYITKDMIQMSNKRRYSVSNNLIKPVKTYNIDMREIYKNPLFIRGRFKSENYETFDILNSPSTVIKPLHIKKHNNKHMTSDDWDHFNP